MIDRPAPPSASLLAPLAAWFEQNRRDLPWRAANLDAPHPDPYGVLVSELMLQQTQVATVIPYFLRWMERFPNPKTLAEAEDDEIHRHWEGLGYYRRARHLQAAASAIADKGWPSDLEGLKGLPGLGPYTAAAIASIAFQQPEPALDGNAFRVLARLLGLREDPRKHANALRQWLSPALAQHGPSRLTQAIMELGALRCTPAPRCEDCPLQTACEARRLGITREIPPPATRTAQKEIRIHLIAVESEAYWLLHQPASRGFLAGLWRWPAIEDFEEPITTSREDMAAETPLAYRTQTADSWPGWTQVYSHRKERVEPLRIRLSTRPHPPEGMRWVKAEELASLPMGRRDQRLRELIGQPDLGRATDLPIDELLRRIL